MANETVLFKRGDSDTITSTPVTDGQILFDTSGNGKMYLDNGTDRLEMGGAITIDASLSKTSTNAIQNKAVTGNILNSLAEVSAATQQNTIAGALALKEVNNSLESSNEHFYYDVQNGVRGFNTDPARGADTFYPFDKGKAYKITVVAIGGAWIPAGWISPKVETTTVITIHKDGTHSHTGGSLALSSNTINTDVANQKGAVQIKSVTVTEIEE